ncbi:hypothetical protein SAMN05216226_102192 [Halovenus aranensis]|uniref:DUF8129 domain-containing protein n=1 Tax=Halovenus aranensis TaxID=890420 RepID=A0A1G8SX24_9EURY|nr:hypothetical protein [Halovenus aranensis]SDJ33799.1 hypothetical protein SAMN05216226_102192 [Halovenus aranensis]
MPSSSQHAAGHDREEFARLRRDFGEDPARFLDHDLIQDSDKRQLAMARIRGIDRIEVIRGWIAVERALDRPTRTGIIRALEEREDTLQEIGERPERLQFGPRRPPSFYEDERGDSEDEEENLSAHQKLNRMRARTDGGEPDGK